MRSKKAQRGRISTFRTMITRNVIVIIIMVMLSVTAVGSLLYFNSMVQQSNTIRIEGLEAVANSIGAELDQLEFCSSLLSSNTALRNRLLYSLEFDKLDEQRRSVLHYQMIREINSLISEYWPLTPVRALGIYFHNEPVQYYYAISQPDLYDLDCIEEAVLHVREDPSRVEYVEHIRIWNSMHLFGVVRTMGHPVTYEPFAETVLLMDVSTIRQCFPDSEVSGQKRRFYLVDDNGNIFTSSIGDETAVNISELGVSMSKLMGESGTISEDFLGHEQIIYVKTDNMPWTLIELVGNDNVLRSILQSAMVQPLVALGCVVVSIFIVFAMARRIERPLHSVIVDMQRVANGELIETTPSNEFVEVNELSIGLNKMVVRLRQTLNLIYQKELKQKEAEFYSLQAQINPHFFYNTLETINLALLVRQQYDLSELLVDLADILRFNVSNKETIIPLGDEMELIRKYLQIMQCRFSDKLRCEMNCDPQTLSCRVVKLLVQPLVENAIMHGVEGFASDCSIHISSFFKDEKLVIEIRDDGIGIEPETAKAICAGTYHAKHERHSGVGLKNIIQRIKMYYGDEYGLDIHPGKEGGTVVVLFLPIIFIEAEESEEEP